MLTASRKRLVLEQSAHLWMKTSTTLIQVAQINPVFQLQRLASEYRDQSVSWHSVACVVEMRIR